MKNTLLFTHSKNILIRLLTVNMKDCLTPPPPKKKCNPILVTILKMRPHYSQSSRENESPSSDTLASYKEVPPPPPRVPIRIRWKPTWCLHTKLHQFELNLGKGLCTFTSFHFQDFGLYLNGFDFYFDGMTVKTSMSWHKPETGREKSKVHEANINIRLCIRWSFTRGYNRKSQNRQPQKVVVVAVKSLVFWIGGRNMSQPLPWVSLLTRPETSLSRSVGTGKREPSGRGWGCHLW